MRDPAIVVAYLARRADGLPAFLRFVDSYRRRPAGRAHALSVLTKGFHGTHAGAWSSWAEHLAGLEYTAFPVPDEGYDLGAYRSYLGTVPGCMVLFLNSHSEVLVDGWLDLLARHARPGCLVGATGSWESHRSNALEPHPMLDGGLIRRLRHGVSAFRASRRPDLRNHPPFPNPAIRTNAFLMPPDLHRCLLECPVPRTKAECHVLESGRDGLSRTVVQAGGSLRLAGADGIAYRPLTWPEAGLFRSAAQGNLIVADNQTRRYTSATLEEKRSLGWSAWRSFHDLGGM